MGEREDFGGVSERDRTFPRGIEGVEEVDEEGYHAEMGVAGLRDPEAETCSQEGPVMTQLDRGSPWGWERVLPGHLRECEEQKSSASESVDGPYRRPGKNEVYQAETKAGKESGDVASASISKDGRAVESNDVDYRYRR